jgi:Flp pilus assembly protein TadB
LGKFAGNGRNNWYVSNGDEAYMIGQIRRELESAQPKTLAQMESDRRARLVRDANTRKSNRHWTAFATSLLFWPSVILYIQPLGNLWGPFLIGLAQWLVIDLVWCWLSRQRHAAKQKRAERRVKRSRTA